MKKTLIYTYLTLLLLPLISALTIEVDCPATVQINELFECEIITTNGNGEYEVKFDITKGSSSVAQLQHENEELKSAYYYTQEIITGEETKVYTLQITEAGTYDAMVKLRQDDKIDTTSFHIEATTLPKHIEESEKEQVQEQEDFETSLEDKKLNEQDSNEPTTTTEEENIIISLNTQTTATEEKKSELIYESKNSTILTYLPIALLLLIALIIGFHFWEKL